MEKAARCAAFLLMLAPGLSQAAQTAAPEIQIAEGSGSFTFVDAKGDASKSMTVYTYLPKRLQASAARIVFVMHGASKTASGYRDTWIEHADRYGFMVLAPLFDREQWGGGAYSYSSVATRDGQPRDPSLWSYNVIEHLFDAVKDATGNQIPRYYIYGHSEGGQFLHRLVLLLPDARYARAVVANPGWYMMPAFGIKYPYGLAGTPVTKASLEKSLVRDVVLLLGDLDRDPNHYQLRRTPQALAQGANRYERGETFFREARNRATEFGSAYGWRLQAVPGAAHENDRMSRPAAAVLMAP